MDAQATKPAAARASRGWFGRNWKWFIPTAMLLLAVAGGGGWYWFTFGVLRHSEPYQMALAAVQKNPKVIEQLGEPIKDSTRFPQGLIHILEDKNRGDANFHFQVTGPKGAAEVATASRLIDGEWGLTSIDVTIGDKPSFDALPASADNDPNGAKKFDPKSKQPEIKTNPDNLPPLDIDIPKDFGQPPSK